MKLIDTAELQRTFDSLFANSESPKEEFVVAAILHLARGAEKALAQQSERIAALEGARTMTFEGAFDPSRTYAAGACVQKGGSIFVALMASNETPGSSDHWRRLASAK